MPKLVPFSRIVIGLVLEKLLGEIGEISLLNFANISISWDLSLRFEPTIAQMKALDTAHVAREVVSASFQFY